MNLNEAKRDFARRTYRGITNIGAGVMLWTAFGILGLLLPPSPQRALIYLFGTGLLLPLGVLISMLLKIDLLAHGNPLSTLSGLIGGLQILFAPLLISAYVTTRNTYPGTSGCWSVRTSCHLSGSTTAGPIFSPRWQLPASLD